LKLETAPAIGGGDLNLRLAGPAIRPTGDEAGRKAVWTIAAAVRNPRRSGEDQTLPKLPIGQARFLAFIAILAGVFVWQRPLLGDERAVLVAFDLAALYYLAQVVRLMWLPHTDIREAARTSDATRFARLGLGVIVAIVIFAAMTAQVLDRSGLSAVHKGLIAASLILVWLFANALYTLHYAHLFYSSNPGDGEGSGLKFPGTDMPDMADFAYFAFTIGVAVQTADVAITSPRIRRVVTAHAILGFFFNLGVLALTINVLGSS
jgi:uncharacterized membrane protein